jgi:hypothetical protein
MDPVLEEHPGLQLEPVHCCFDVFALTGCTGFQLRCSRVLTASSADGIAAGPSKTYVTPPSMLTAAVIILHDAISTCDFHLFGFFKKALNGHRFWADEDV